MPRWGPAPIPPRTRFVEARLGHRLRGMLRLRAPLVSLTCSSPCLPRAVRSSAKTRSSRSLRGYGGKEHMAGRRRCDVPQKAWSAKRERQYEHIKEGLKDHGRSEDLAEEIAARTANTERARSGAAKTKSRSSTQDISSGRRGGLRS